MNNYQVFGRSLRQLFTLIFLFSPQFYWSQKPVEKVILKPAHQIIDTLDYLYYPVKEDFEIRLNKKEYLSYLELKLNDDPNCFYDRQYWDITEKNGRTDLNAIRATELRPTHSLDHYLFLELLNDHATIWDKVSSNYTSCFYIQDYEDIGTGGKEICVTRPGKSDDVLEADYQKRFPIVRKIIRVY
jgi:hypothetical protein